MSDKAKADLRKIKLLVLDVDGVMTDGGIIVNGDGSESKRFCVRDGHGIRMWRRAGLKVVLLSGRVSSPTSKRAEQLEVDDCLEGCHFKLAAIQELVEKMGLEASEVAFVGDDLPDLPVIRYAGFGAAVANAVEEVRREADYVTRRAGGDGAVREVIEYILKESGRWGEEVKRYLPQD